MRPFYTSLIILVFTQNSFAQSPEGMSYQAIVRDSGNALVTEQPIGVQISILQGSATGTAVYAETHTTTTNSNGLLTLVIGTGSTADDFSAIDWANGPYFIKTETDPTGGTNYSITATSQMLSVPYALYAKTAGSTQQATPTLTSVLQQSNSAGSQQIKGLADPTDAQDAVTFAFVNQYIQDLQNQINNQLNDIDNDYDGYTENQGDCDDANENLSPGSQEICDGIDNDCDGEIDEGVGPVWYPDSDFDGYGDGSNPLQSCMQPEGYVSIAGDCDDESASINPDTTEIEDGLDNDCDGLIDEGLIAGNITDIDGNEYDYIVYGTQSWTIANAAMETYRDGTPIPQVTDAFEWANLTTGAWCYYNNNPLNEKLYNWYAVMGIHDNDPNTPNKELAPEGWHVPSDAEWTVLENYLIANGYNYDGTTTENKIAKAMSTNNDIFWTNSTEVGAPGNNASLNNSSGFNALPSGYRFDEGVFIGGTGLAAFWSNNEFNAYDGLGYGLTYDNPSLFQVNGGKFYGLSVRFVKDTP